VLPNLDFSFKFDVFFLLEDFLRLQKIYENFQVTFGQESRKKVEIIFKILRKSQYKK